MLLEIITDSIRKHIHWYLKYINKLIFAAKYYCQNSLSCFFKGSNGFLKVSSSALLKVYDYNNISLFAARIFQSLVHSFWRQCLILKVPKIFHLQSISNHFFTSNHFACTISIFFMVGLFEMEIPISFLRFAKKQQSDEKTAKRHCLIISRNCSYEYKSMIRNSSWRCRIWCKFQAKSLSNIYQSMNTK